MNFRRLLDALDHGGIRMTSRLDSKDRLIVPQGDGEFSVDHNGTRHNGFRPASWRQQMRISSPRRCCWN